MDENCLEQRQIGLSIVNFDDDDDDTQTYTKEQDCGKAEQPSVVSIILYNT